MALTDQEKEQIKAMIDRGEKLPARYKSLLFADAPEVELVWQGKTSEVTSVVLPFQSIEQIDEPRQETGKPVDHLFAADTRGRQSGGWTNKLIWGDNKLVLSSLKNGPLRQEIEAAGGLKLIYIDPPFDVGADFSVNLEVGDGEILTKEPSVIEELAYRDTWGRGTDSYLSMMYERLKLMHGLLAEDGSIYVHCDWRVNSAVRLAMDEIFRPENFLNEIVWCYKERERTLDFYNPKHDAIYFYAKNRTARGRPFNWSSAASEYSIVTRGKFKFDDDDGKGPYQIRGRNLQGSPIRAADGLNRTDEAKYPGLTYRDYLAEREGVAPRDWWEISIINKASEERLYYPTQKPQQLIGRILAVSSNQGDLVADFFCGSGTTLAVAEKLGRKWIGCDLGRFAIHTTRKRLIGVQRELKAAGKPYRSFEILNLGKYERQYFVGIDPMLPEAQRRVQALQREEHYLTLILTAYQAERLFQMPPFHGKKGAALVVVGPVDAPVTQSQVRELVEECHRKKIAKVDVLGFEFEMGLVPVAQDEARGKGISLSLKYIPKDVFDRRAVERGQVKFYDVAYVELKPAVEKLKAQVRLTDFGVFYRQDDLDSLGETLKPGGGKVTVANGQVVKMIKDKQGVVTREVLTKKWTDWIDYWAVDFHFGSRPEVMRVRSQDGGETEMPTGNFIFENEWQSFRTRKDRKLELASGWHEYDKPGRYKIAVKVIDIFGNDTTKVVEVKV